MLDHFDRRYHPGVNPISPIDERTSFWKKFKAPTPHATANIALLTAAGFTAASIGINSWHTRISLPKTPVFQSAAQEPKPTVTPENEYAKHYERYLAYKQGVFTFTDKPEILDVYVEANGKEHSVPFSSSPSLSKSTLVTRIEPPKGIIKMVRVFGEKHEHGDDFTDKDINGRDIPINTGNISVRLDDGTVLRGGGEWLKTLDRDQISDLPSGIEYTQAIYVVQSTPRPNSRG